MEWNSQSSRPGEELMARNAGAATGNVLEFDPVSGELVVRPRNLPGHPDATAVDQIATDGFAAAGAFELEWELCAMASALCLGAPGAV